MIFKSVRDTVALFYKNLRGWRTNRKIVVIESDDWGSIRMPSREVYDQMLKLGYKVNECPYNSNDSVETSEDLELLFETLHKHKGGDIKPAVITANTVMANPDFSKIEESGYKKYFYEPFTATYERYNDSGQAFTLFKEGIKKSVFFPQFHGREHVNINRWLLGLRENDKKLIVAFKNKMFTVHEGGIISGRRDHLDAFGLGYSLENEIDPLTEIVKDGLRIFEETFGFKSESIIAPCYIWGSNIERTFSEYGIKYIQGSSVQRAPDGENGEKLTSIRHYTGEKNRRGQVYLTRNVLFEPTEMGRKDAVERAIKGISVAFSLKKPAIISSHRVNYIGRINPENRDQNLRLLDELLMRIIKKYPDVEFMHSAQLGNLISSTQKN